MSTGIKRILRMSNEKDTSDPEEKFMQKKIDHISQDTVDRMYQTRLNDQ